MSLNYNASVNYNFAGDYNQADIAASSTIASGEARRHFSLKRKESPDEDWFKKDQERLDQIKKIVSQRGIEPQIIVIKSKPKIVEEITLEPEIIVAPNYNLEFLLFAAAI